MTKLRQKNTNEEWQNRCLAEKKTNASKYDRKATNEV